LPRGHIRRILTSHSTVLILTRGLALEVREVHDARTIQHNDRCRRKGRPDLQHDPLVFTIEVRSVAEVLLTELTLVTIRAAGYRTTEEFDQYWVARRRVVPEEVFVHWFQMVEDARFLHARVERGYTSDPARSVAGEPQALSPRDLASVQHQSVEQRAEAMRQRGRSIGLRLKEAARAGNFGAYAGLSDELAQLSTEVVTVGGTATTV
jgi:hypothetical protein